MPHLSDNDRQNLVAYLDGELDAATAHALESKLSLNPLARAEAEALRRTWELLDYLPRPEPSTDFTNRTLSKLSVQPITGKQTLLVRPRRRWLAALAWAAAVLLAAAGGYGGAELLWPPRPAPTVAEEGTADVDETLARHLGVIENRALFEAAENLDFLRALDQPDLFGDDADS